MYLFFYSRTNTSWNGHQEILFFKVEDIAFESFHKIVKLWEIRDFIFMRVSSKIMKFAKNSFCE